MGFIETPELFLTVFSIERLFELCRQGLPDETIEAILVMPLDPAEWETSYFTTLTQSFVESATLLVPAGMLRFRQNIWRNGIKTEER